MQQPSSTLVAALQSGSRQPVVQAIADWSRIGSTDNLVGPSSVEGNITAWIPGGGTGTQPTLSLSSARAYKGTQSLLITWGTSTFFPTAQLNVSGLVVGRSYVFSLRAYVPAGQKHLMAAVAGLGTGSQTTEFDKWIKIQRTFVANATTVTLQVWPATQPVGGETGYVDDVQLTPVLATYDDLSPLLESITVDRNIQSDLPPEANLVNGPVAAEVTMELAGRTNDTIKPSQLLSGYTGYLANLQRLGVPLDIDFGFVTSAGKEYIDSFKGKVRSIDTDDDGTATITGLDGPESLRKAITLPAFAAIEPNAAATFANYMAPGLMSSWVIDYILRQNGYYSSPPIRASALLSATLLGSARPEVGGIWSAYTYDGSTFSPQGAASFIQHGDGSTAFGGVGSSVTRSSQAHYNATSTIKLDTGSNLYVEFAKFTAWGSGIPTVFQCAALAPGSVGAPGNDLLAIQIGRTQTVVTLGRTGGGSNSVAIPGVPTLTAGQTYYIALHIAFTSTGATINMRLNGTTYSATLTGVTGGSGGPNLPYVMFNAPGSTILGAADGRWIAMSGVQVTTEAFSSTMWSDTFIPNAYLEPSLNSLIVTPNVEERQPWSLLQEIAIGENGVILFDEAGIVRFYNANHWSNSTAVATIRSTTNLRKVSTSEAIDTVRNIVRVPANPYVIDKVDSIVWEASETYRVPANDFITVAADVNGVLLGLDDTFAYNGSAGTWPGATTSQYRASQTSDGSGAAVSNLNISVQRYPSRVTIRIANPNAFDIWVVQNTVDASLTGSAALHIGGRLARLPDDQYRYSARDQASIDTFGEQTTELDENPWRQTAAAAETLANTLLARLKDPHPVLKDVEIVADPRIQLTDRVTLIEMDSTMVARDYWVVGSNQRLDASGYVQSLTLREAGLATTGMLDTFVWDVSLWDSLSGWA